MKVVRISGWIFTTHQQAPNDMFHLCQTTPRHCLTNMPLSLARGICAIVEIEKIEREKRFK